MAPLPSSFTTEHHPRRCSKAQMCFFNILHIISVFPAADVTDNKRCLINDISICENQGFVVDLNIRLHPQPEAEHIDRLKSDSFVADESELAVEEERATEHSEISHVGDQSSGVDFNGVSSENDKSRDEGYLGLLIEAAQLILVDDSEQSPIRNSESVRSKYKEASSTSAKRKSEWYEDTSPVVKSKRGRNQVLPHKYRDSVVELWGSPVSNHRSISDTAVRSKRR